MRNTHCRTWNMARKLTNEENETHTLEHLEYGRNLKNMEQETNTLQELEYGEKTDQKDLEDGNKIGKKNLENHRIVPGMW